MSDNFKQIVDLQAGDNQKKEIPKTNKKVLTPRPSKRKKSKVSEIDHVYKNEDESSDVKNELSQISRPKIKNNNVFKQISIFLIFIIFLLVFFYFFTNKNKTNTSDSNTINQENQFGDWYSVQLTNNETYYGFIKDLSSDPVVLENVYYNYNQISKDENIKTAEKSNANIRLVKRGKEAHGPDGTMDIVRLQIMYMEILGTESKIRQAILDYEK